MKTNNKNAKNTKNKTVLFYQVPLRSTFVYNGETFLKHSLRKATPTKGGVVTFPDATYVRLTA